MAIVGINNIVHFGAGKEITKTDYGYHVISSDYSLRAGQVYDHCISSYGVITIGPRPAQDQTLNYSEITNMTKAIESGLKKMLEGEEDEACGNRNERKDIWNRPLYSH